MTAQKDSPSGLDLIGNAFLYLFLIALVGGLIVLGADGFFGNPLLTYGSQVSLLIAVVLPCFPFTSDESYQRFLSRGAGGLLLASAVAAVEFLFLLRLELSTLLTIAALAVVFAIGWIKTVPTEGGVGFGLRLLELTGAGLTAFGALLQPVLVRLGFATEEGLGLYGLPPFLIGLLILFYARIARKRKET